MFLITGGTGLIGSYIARKLVEKGQKVVIYELFPDLEVIRDIMDKVTLIQADILDTIDLVSTIKKHSIRYIIHLAYLLRIASDANPAKAVRVNCDGLINIFEAARITDVERVVWASSVDVLGDVASTCRAHTRAEKPLDEDAPLNMDYRTQTLYGACKAFNEFMGQYYYVKYGLDNIGLRPTWIYGGKISRAGTVTGLQKLIIYPALGKPVELTKPFHKDQRLDLIYVKDIANAFLLACEVKEPKHRIFNAGYGELHSINEVINIVKKFIPDAVIKVAERDSEPGWASDDMLCDTTRIREELGFRPQYNLEKGIEETINDVRKWTTL